MTCRIASKLCLAALMAAYSFAVAYDAVMDWVDDAKRTR